jgi:hypothetical protein
MFQQALLTHVNVSTHDFYSVRILVSGMSHQLLRNEIEDDGVWRFHRSIIDYRNRDTRMWVWVAYTTHLSNMLYRQRRLPLPAYNSYGVCAEPQTRNGVQYG